MSHQKPFHHQKHDDLERLMLSRSKHLTRILERSRTSLKAGKGLSHEETWSHLES
jgi:hypothetical protein